MSNLWLNIRIFYWHLQIGDPNWYSVRISYNSHHKGFPEGRFAWY